jgi:hypothetical protein
MVDAIEDLNIYAEGTRLRYHCTCRKTKLDGPVEHEHSARTELCFNPVMARAWPIIAHVRTSLTSE